LIDDSGREARKMEFGFNEEQQRLREEVRSFCKSKPWGEIMSEIAPGYSPSFYRKLGERGWLGLPYDKKYGGQGKDPIYEAISSEELGRAGAPVSSLYPTNILVGELIANCGSEELKIRYLPRIIRGEIQATGVFTEPEAGSDLGQIQMRAVREGDCFIINGQKMFASFIQREPKYSIPILMALMAKTDPDAPPSKGLSLFLFENTVPGITCNVLKTMAPWKTTQAFFDNVKVPKENLLGQENQGWDCLMRNKVWYWNKGRARRLGSLQRGFDMVVKYVKETESNGHPLSQDPLIRQKIANMAIDLHAIRLLTYRVAWMQSKGLDALSIEVIVKVIHDEAMLRFTNWAMQILGLAGQLQDDSKYAPLKGVVQEAYRQNSLRHFYDGGGPCAIRSFIASYNLGLPENTWGKYLGGVG
jgi:alkylation response protein AidB-like acyl-CoA dehydrogenase